MLSHGFEIEHAVDPSAPLTESIRWLSSVGSHIAVGVLAGVLAERLVRRRGLRWTWPESSLALLLLARPILGGTVVTPAIAALCATLRGRHRHREDVMAGEDLAEIAASRPGPLTALSSIAHRAASRLGVAPIRGPLRGERMIVGCSQAGAIASIPFGVDGGGRHTLVVGATGSGKTVTETWIAACAVDAGLGAVVVDPKGDPRMREHLLEAAHRNGRRFIEWTPEGPSVYNPFGHGSASEIADKALAGEQFTEPHYQRQAQRYLGHVVRGLRGVGAVVSLPAIAAHLDPSELESLCDELPAEQATATREYLGSLAPRQRGDLGGVCDRLAILAESDVALWLDPSRSCGDAFDLLGAIRERAVVYFALQVDSLPLLARMLAVAIVQDLQAAMVALQRAPLPTVVVIDEFAAIAAEQVAHLFARARSAGINLLLGTQELADLRPEGRRQLQEQVLGNLSSLIAHRQVVPDSVDLVSQLAGSRGVWRTSRSSDGRWTRTRSSAPLLASPDIRGLPPGRAAVIELGATATACMADMFSSTPTQTRSLT
jgi:TraM recognition site of TraD and TraG/Helicase HerA-like C-terminal